MFLRKNSKLFLFIHVYFILFTLIKNETNNANTFSIISPNKVAKEIEKINQNLNSEVPYRIGKFGDIPFGKTFLSMIFIEEQNDGSNYWCNYDDTKTPTDLNSYSSIYSEYLPMILVDQGQCSYSKKALNVQLRGGSVMLIVDDDNNLDNNDKYNILDLRGNSIKIPTLIIPRNYGDIIKNYIYSERMKKKENNIDLPIEPIITSIKFSAYNEDGTVEMDLFLSSDDMNAVHFFKEFNRYKELLGKKLKFNPIYKYHNYAAYESNNDINQIYINAPCFSKKEMHYCSTNNYDLNLKNGRIILLENLRQSCIFINYGLDLYWKYMIEFGKACVNPKKPNFSEECSLIALYYIGLDNRNVTKIKSCMQDLIDFNSKVDDDYQLYNYRRVYEYPLITLNGIHFKGMWLPRTIFNSICTSFINDEKICGSPEIDKLSKNVQIYSPLLIIFVVIFLFTFTLLLIICYRRTVFRSIEQTVIEKIQTETIKSIGKHKKNKNEKNQLYEES